MNKIIKLGLFAFLAITVSFTGSLEAQTKITKVGVIDMREIYAKYPSDSKGIETYNKQKEKVEAELLKKSREILSLRDELAAESDTNSSRAKSLKKQIESKTNAYTKYYKTENTKLDTMLKKLQSSDDLARNILRAVRNVAEREGLSVILNREEVYWWSPTIDITGLVIKQLE